MAADMIDSMAWLAYRTNRYPRANGKTWAWLAYDEFSSQSTLKPGDRVRIREGYQDAGKVGFFDGKSVTRPEHVCIVFGAGDWYEHYLLAAAIEPYPYSREERIERAIEDYASILNACDNYVTDDDRALLFAIIDAGV